jgi:hypothetical protein
MRLLIRKEGEVYLSVSIVKRGVSWSEEKKSNTVSSVVFFDDHKVARSTAKGRKS